MSVTRKPDFTTNSGEEENICSSKVLKSYKDTKGTLNIYPQTLPIPKNKMPL